MVAQSFLTQEQDCVAIQVSLFVKRWFKVFRAAAHAAAEVYDLKSKTRISELKDKPNHVQTWNREIKIEPIQTVWQVKCINAIYQQTASVRIGWQANCINVR